MQKDNPYLDFSVLDESRDYYNVPSFNSLNEESADDELFEKERAALLKSRSDGNGRGKGETSEDCHKDETEMDQDISPNDVNKIDFNSSSLRDEDSSDRKDVKMNIEALEMAVYRPGRRGILL